MNVSCFTPSRELAELQIEWFRERSGRIGPTMTHTNHFWIAANIIFDLATGATSRVLMLVNNENEATVFNSPLDAQNYLVFVERRAADIQWVVEGPGGLGRQGWIIRGVQTVITPGPG